MSDEKQEHTCKTCPAWRVDGDSVYTGRCRARAPITYDDGDGASDETWNWPATDGTEWCMEHPGLRHLMGGMM